MSAIETLYTVREVSRIFGLNESRIRYWAQTGFINPSGSQAGRRLYTFRDLVGIRAAKELLDRGIPLQRVRKNIQKLRKALPELEHPLTRLRVCSDGENLVVEQERAAFEPLTGQLVLDFEVNDLQTQVAQVLELPTTDGAPDSSDSEEGMPAEYADRSDQPTTAYGWFLRGCACDGARETLSEAIAAYRRALELDPCLAAAYTNLGNLHYLQGEREEARRQYMAASTLEPDQPQARYNLANLYEEEGDLDMAIAEYRRTLSLDPDFADAHFNLALSLEQVGSQVQALQHWRRYLDQVSRGEPPAGPWLDIARSHLAQLEQLQR